MVTGPAFAKPWPVWIRVSNFRSLPTASMRSQVFERWWHNHSVQRLVRASEATHASIVTSGSVPQHFQVSYWRKDPLWNAFDPLWACRRQTDDWPRSVLRETPLGTLHSFAGGILFSKFSLHPSLQKSSTNIISYPPHLNEGESMKYYVSVTN